MKRIFLLSVIMISIAGTVYARDTLVVTAAPTLYAQPLGHKLAGPAVDLITTIFKEFDVPVETRIMHWAKAVESLKTGEIDAILTLFYTSERAEFVDFSAPYCDAEATVIVPKGKSFPYKEWGDLIGKKGFMIKEDSQGEAFDRFARENLNIQRVRQLDDLIRLTALPGRVDYTIYSKNDFLIRAGRLGFTDKIEVLPVPVTSEPVHIGFSKKSPFRTYLPRLSEKIIDLRKNGTIDGMLEKTMIHYIRAENK